MTALDSPPQAAAADAGTWPRQPFDPLSAEEIRSAVGVLRREKNLGDRTRFVAVYLQA